MIHVLGVQYDANVRLRDSHLTLPGDYRLKEGRPLVWGQVIPELDFGHHLMPPNHLTLRSCGVKNVQQLKRYPRLVIFLVHLFSFGVI
jgi:hypothetical protein